MQIRTNKIFINTVGDDYLEQIQSIKPLYDNKLSSAKIVRDAADCYYLLYPKRSDPTSHLSSDSADFDKYSNQEKLDREHWYNDMDIEDYFKKVPPRYRQKNINQKALRLEYARKKNGKDFSERALMQNYFCKYFDLDGITIILQGLKFAFELAEKLQLLFPKVAFQVIFSFQTIEDNDELEIIGPCPVVNFHKIRSDTLLLTEDLDDYKINGILTIATATP